MWQKEKILEQIKDGLIVSCQALEDEPLYDEAHSLMPFMALAAKKGNAIGIRANSVRDIVAIKEKVDLPLIGIIKKQYPGFEQHITVTMAEVDALVMAKADIIAFDATNRLRYDGLTSETFIQAIKKKYPKQILMADISTVEEGIAAERAGVDFVGTTLSGYTPYSQQLEGPDYNLISELAVKVRIPIIAEGRIHYPEQAKMALEKGAYSVVVGGAITRPKEIIERFTKQLVNISRENIRDVNEYV